MKKFVFEITIDESDLEGDEFWEDALAVDGTGITELTANLEFIIKESNLILSDKNIKDIIKLKEYKE
jgi:hypothetical protein